MPKSIWEPNRPVAGAVYVSSCADEDGSHCGTGGFQAQGVTLVAERKYGCFDERLAQNVAFQASDLCIHYT